MSTNLLEMNHIKKQFDGLQVLKDVSIHVEEGEVLSIIGPSGSGKSTLLRCATLLTRIDGGEISYMGKKAIWTENDRVCMPPKNEIKEIQSCFRSGVPELQSFSAFYRHEKYHGCADPCTEKKQGRSI